MAASQLGLDELQFAYWVAERVLHALHDQATCATVQAGTGMGGVCASCSLGFQSLQPQIAGVPPMRMHTPCMQAELAAAGIPDPAAALRDLRYSCHEACADQLTQHDQELEQVGLWRGTGESAASTIQGCIHISSFVCARSCEPAQWACPPLNASFHLPVPLVCPYQAGEGEELRAALDRHAAGLLAERPDLAAAWARAAHGHYHLGNYSQAQVVREKKVWTVCGTHAQQACVHCT